MSAIWTDAEIVLHTQTAYQAIAMRLPVFWDQTYLENLPTGFSYTSPFDLDIAPLIDEFFDFGLGTYTLSGLGNYVKSDELGLVGDERLQTGPAWFTCPDEYTDGWVADVGASLAVPALAELPDSLTGLERVSWDTRGIDGLSPRLVATHDARYEYTRGEVYGFLWQHDGLRMLRQVRVPAQVGSVVTVTGSWGILRSPADLSLDAPVGAFGVPRVLPGHQPIGACQVGLPRRPYLESHNVRVEYRREGRPLVAMTDQSELPDRFTIYLRDYVEAQLLARVGPGQDLTLSAHFTARWERDLARIQARIEKVTRQRVAVLGGDGISTVTRPPRPSRPWQYGAPVR